MARAYSQDLRDRVIDAALSGMPARRACSLNQTFADSGIPLDSDRSESALDAFTPKECANYFAAAGYDPD